MDGWMNQAYSRLSTTHGHITDCKLDSVVYAGGGVVIFLYRWSTESQHATLLRNRGEMVCEIVLGVCIHTCRVI